MARKTSKSAGQTKSFGPRPRIATVKPPAKAPANFQYQYGIQYDSVPGSPMLGALSNPDGTMTYVMWYTPTPGFPANPDGGKAWVQQALDSESPLGSVRRTMVRRVVGPTEVVESDS